MTDYAAMTDREIDALVAERLSWAGPFRNYLGAIHADVPHFSAEVTVCPR